MDFFRSVLLAFMLLLTAVGVKCALWVVGWLLSSREERAVEKTRWVSASVAALWNMICVSDLLSAELSPKKLPDVLIAVLGLSGMLMAFGNAFFLCIFLDKRTRLRGGVALGSWLMLMVILALIPAGK